MAARAGSFGKGRARRTGERGRLPSRAVLILGIIAFGVAIGWLARTLIGRRDLSWGRTISFGIIGSFVGGLLVSLLSGDGLDLRPSGIIGSIVGAILLILGDELVTKRLRHQTR